MKKFVTILLIGLLFLSILSPIVNAKTTTNTSEKGPILEKIKGFINRVITFFKNILGLAQDVEDIEPPTVFDKDYKPYYQDNNNNPGSENPTDTSISVSIKDFNVEYTENDDTLEFDMNFKGSTTGDVYGCYYLLVNYYDDGTNSYANIWMSPIESKLEMEDYTFEMTFIGTGSGGDEDWSTFKARQYVSGISVDYDEVPFDMPEYNKGKTVKDVRLFVRAFSDKELTQWNQDSISIMNKMSGSVYDDLGEDDDGTGIPGFETLAVIGAIGIALILLRRRK